MTLLTLAAWLAAILATITIVSRLKQHRQERIVNIPCAEVDSICGDFCREGASVCMLRQPDGRYTVNAHFGIILSVRWPAIIAAVAWAWLIAYSAINIVKAYTYYMLIQ